MRVNGQDLLTRKNVSLVLPRGDGEKPIVFYAAPVKSMEEFYKLCPDPQPPQKYTPGGVEYNYKSPEYIEAMKAQSKKRWAYIVIKTLEPSSIEWDRVNPGDPSTWLNAEVELQAGLGHYEFALVIALVEEANCLDTRKMEVARESFFRQQAEKPVSPVGQNSEAENMPSGELAKDSA